jgi:pyridoxine kinase
MNILSIQSHVAYGHAGNSAAVFPLQRIGCDVWPVHTVQFSNHTGYPTWKGRAFGGGMIREVIAGLAERGALAECNGIISGYMGSVEVGEAILDAVARIRQDSPGVSYCCDPVIGDVGRGVFVAEGVAEFIRKHAVPAADIIAPNHFELDFLAGRATTTLASALAAVDKLHAMGPRTILVTSLRTEETPPDEIDLLVSDKSGRFRVRTPWLPITVSGAGDIMTGLFLAHYFRVPAAEALAQAVSSIYGVLSHTAEAGASELRLVEAQEEFVNPSNVFSAEAI